MANPHGNLSIMNENSISIPKPALVLGLAGLIPFFTASLLAVYPHTLELVGIDSSILTRVTVDQQNQPTTETQLSALKLLTTYAAVILSFLGGIRWGQALNQPSALSRWQPLTYSVLPSLAGWFALLYPLNIALVILAIGFLLQFIYDHNSVRQGELPPWFSRLRVILSTGAILSLLLGLYASLSINS